MNYGMFAIFFLIDNISNFTIMKSKLIFLLLGALLGILGYYFADDMRRLISNASGDWIKYLLLITAFVNTCLIAYILKLTKDDNDS